MDCTGLAAVSWHFRFLLLPIPKKTSNGSGWDLAPLPVRRDLSRPLGLPPAQTDVRTLYTVLKADGFNPVGHEMTGTTARLQIENLRYRSSSQAVGARGPDCQSVFWG